MNHTESGLDLLPSLAIGAAGSLVASLVFTAFMWLLKPQIDISAKIARTTRKGKKIFRIKVASTSRKAPMGIRAELHIVRPVNAPGGPRHNATDVKLKRSQPLSMYKYSHVQRRKTRYRFAYYFITDMDLEKKWTPSTNSTVRFQLYCTHEFSGFGKLFTRVYHHKESDIVDGDFEIGSLDIVGRKGSRRTAGKTDTGEAE